MGLTSILSSGATQPHPPPPPTPPPPPPPGRWLECAVGDARRAVSGHLLDIVMRRHDLPAHLGAIKQYLLLGQGDFARYLLDLSEEELGRPAQDVSQFALAGALEAAVRACSGAAGGGRDPGDVLRCLDVKLARGMAGERGWDVFELQYRAEGPLAGVLSPDCMKGVCGVVVVVVGRGRAAAACALGSLRAAPSAKASCQGATSA